MGLAGGAAQDGEFDPWTNRRTVALRAFDASPHGPIEWKYF
jgi:hypothetical protein